MTDATELDLTFNIKVLPDLIPMTEVQDLELAITLNQGLGPMSVSIKMFQGKILELWCQIPSEEDYEEISIHSLEEWLIGSRRAINFEGKMLMLESLLPLDPSKFINDSGWESLEAMQKREQDIGLAEGDEHTVTVLQSSEKDHE